MRLLAGAGTYGRPRAPCLRAGATTPRLPLHCKRALKAAIYNKRRITRALLLILMPMPMGISLARHAAHNDEARRRRSAEIY